MLCVNIQIFYYFVFFRVVLMLNRLTDNPCYGDDFLPSSNYQKFDKEPHLSGTMSYRERVASFCKQIVLIVT